MSDKNLTPDPSDSQTPDPKPVKLTPAQRKALDVLAQTKQAYVETSNRTILYSSKGALVHQKIAEGLIDLGLAKWYDAAYHYGVQITPAGRAALSAAAPTSAPMVDSQPSPYKFCVFDDCDQPAFYSHKGGLYCYEHWVQERKDNPDVAPARQPDAGECVYAPSEEEIRAIGGTSEPVADVKVTYFHRDFGDIWEISVPRGGIVVNVYRGAKTQGLVWTSPVARNLYFEKDIDLLIAALTEAKSIMRTALDAERHEGAGK